MNKWNIEISGLKLRDAIDNCQDKKDQAELILILRDTVKETIERLTKYYQKIEGLDEDDIEWELSELNEIYEILDGDEKIVLMEDWEILKEYGFKGSEDLVDERLCRFYDECDNQRIWITL